MIPLVDFKAEYKEIRKDIDSAISRVLGSGWYILGGEVSAFEKKLAEYIGVKYALGVASGTDALTLAIKSLNLKPKDKILMPANCYPTAFGLALSGQPLALCDVDPKSLNVTLDTIEKSFTKDIKVILIVHLYGNPVEMDSIKKFARKNNAYLIEDCAQALGSIYKGKKVGSFGDISCFSFYPTKNLGAYGDGGAILTNNKEVFEKAKILRMYGEESRYQSVLLGHNSRLDEIQAAILLEKFKYLAKWKRQKKLIISLYKKLLKNLPLEILEENSEGDQFYHLFVVKTNKRDKLAQYLNMFGVTTGIHYPICVHLTKAFLGLGYKNGSFPVSEEAAKKVLSLPLYPQMTDDTVMHVASALKKFFSK